MKGALLQRQRQRDPVGHVQLCVLARLRWAFVIRWLHDACLEDFLDGCERATGRERWSLWVRLVRRAFGLIMHQPQPV